ncbi:hypothetical protein LTS10_003055 [Elasticomyces elasticus]|nr:hypothetical protein LTS10_003055 [Elasticomyces elasticus]
MLQATTLSLVGTTSDEARVAWIMQERRDREALKSYNEAHSVCARMSKIEISFELLQVCRQLHREAALVPFTSNHFVFRSGRSLENFVRSILLPQARAVRHATLVCGTDLLHKAGTRTMLANRVWGLQELTVYLELRPGDPLTRPQQERIKNRLRFLKSSPLSSLTTAGYNAAKWYQHDWSLVRPWDHSFRTVAQIVELETAIQDLLVNSTNTAGQFPAMR